MKKIISTLILISIIIAPVSLFAQQPSSTGSKPSTTANTSGQAGSGEKESEVDSAAGDAVADAAGCAAGTVVSAIVQEAIGAATSAAGIGTEVPTKEIQLRSKENIWDAIGYCLINGLITYFSQATINWINGGFEGSPAFVQNPTQLLKDIADQEAGGLIQELGGGFLCGDFKPQVQIALLENYTQGNSAYRRRSQCTLSQVVKNVEAFKQDFNQGGWKGWFSLTQVPQNNSVGAYLMAEQELRTRVNKSQTRTSTELDWNSGFLSFKKCQTDAKTGKKRNCQTTTPGKVVADQLTQTLDLPRERLVLADEFNEIVTALVNQLIKIALNEALTTEEDSEKKETSNE
jgi:hypothetical protein